MQEIIINRLRELLASDEYLGVIGWAEGETPFDRTPHLFDREHLDELRYDSFCGANLAKYLVSRTAGQDKKIIALLKPCDSYSFNQLCTEHRIDRDKVYVIGIGCKGKIDVEKIRRAGIKGILEITEDGDLLKIKTLYGDREIARADVLLEKTWQGEILGAAFEEQSIFLLTEDEIVKSDVQSGEWQRRSCAKGASTIWAVGENALRVAYAGEALYVEFD